MAMKENSKKVLNYLKEINGQKDVTSADVAVAVDLGKRQVDGIFTAFQKKGLGVRVPAEAELEDGTHKPIKLLTLTEEGMNFDPDSVVVA